MADLVPIMLEAEANQQINFSAAGSSDPEQDSITFRWSLNGLPFGENPAASCMPANDPAIVKCRFVMPGTHAVTVEVEDGDGLVASKSTSVTVSLNNGYLSLVLNAPEVSFGSLKIGDFGLRPDVQDLIMIQAADAGLSITFFALPAGEVMTGIERGIGEGGFTLSNSPAAFDALRAEICPNC